MSLSFEGFTKFYPDCEVISGFGTPVVWARLPTNATIRCIAASDIRYSKVFVAIAEGNKAIAFSPFEGRQLQQRIEQFLKVRSQDVAIIEPFPSPLLAFARLSITELYIAANGTRTPYSDSLEIWLKEGESLPSLIDTVEITDGQLEYGTQSLDIAAINAQNTAISGFELLGFDANVDSIYCHALSSAIALIYVNCSVAADYVSSGIGRIYAAIPVTLFVLYDRANQGIIGKSISTRRFTMPDNFGNPSVYPGANSVPIALSSEMEPFAEWLPVNANFTLDFDIFSALLLAPSWLHYPNEVVIPDVVTTTNPFGGGVDSYSYISRNNISANDRVKRPPFGDRPSNVVRFVYSMQDFTGGGENVVITIPSNYSYEFASGVSPELKPSEPVADGETDLGLQCHWSYPDRIPFVILNTPGYNRYTEGDSDPYDLPDMEYPTNGYNQNSLFQLLDEECEYYTFTRETDSSGLTVDENDTYLFVLTQEDLDEMDFGGQVFADDRAKSRTITNVEGNISDTDFVNNEPVYFPFSDLIDGFTPDAEGAIANGTLKTGFSSTSLSIRRDVYFSETSGDESFSEQIQLFFFDYLIWQSNCPSLPPS